MSTYEPPVDALLIRGSVKHGETNWPDYVAEYHLTDQHVPALIRMATDPSLYEGTPGQFWGTVHARRALGQLRALDAVNALLDAYEPLGDYDEFWPEEVGRILAMVGPPAIPILTTRISDTQLDPLSRAIAIEAIGKIGETFPEFRDECVAILMKKLAEHENHKDAWSLNGEIVCTLMDLKAVESVPVIEAAFAAEVVDELECGSWPHVRFGLGLGLEPSGPEVSEKWANLHHFPALDRLLPPARPNPDKLRKLLKGTKAPKKGKRR